MHRQNISNCPLPPPPKEIQIQSFNACMYVCINVASQVWVYSGLPNKIDIHQCCCIQSFEIQVWLFFIHGTSFSYTYFASQKSIIVLARFVIHLCIQAHFVFLSTSTLKHLNEINLSFLVQDQFSISFSQANFIFQLQ